MSGSRTLRFGLDFDGTIADTNAMKSDWIRDRIGLEIPAWLCSHYECYPYLGDLYREMSGVVYSEEWTHRTPPISGAIEAVRTLAKVGEVHLVTMRPGDWMVHAEKWLEEHGSPH